MGSIDTKSLKIVVQSSSYRGICLLLGIITAYATISPLTIYSSTTLELFSYALFCIIAFYLCSKESKNGIRDKNARLLCFICFLFAFIIPILIHLQMPFTTDILQWVTIFLIVTLTDNNRVTILNTAVTILTIVVLLAIIEYIIGYITGVSVQLATVYNESSVFSRTSYFTHSFFNLYWEGELQHRFQALTSEPGHLGAICGFMVGFLPFNKKYRKNILVFLLAGILSLSLAFYIYLLFIVIYKLIAKQIGFKLLFVLVTIVVATAYIFQEPIQKAIVERILYKDQVDNRTGDTANKFIENLFTSSETFYGVGNRTAYKGEEGSNQGNAGLKWKLYQYGVCGVGFYFLGMYFLYRRFRNRNVSMLFGILFFLLYFYSVANWGIPIFMLLLFTTLPIDNRKRKNELNSSTKQVVLN